MNLRVRLEMMVKLLLRKRDIFVEQFIVNIKWHRQYPDAQCLALCLRDPAVAVCKDRDSLTHMIDSPL